MFKWIKKLFGCKAAGCIAPLEISSKPWKGQFNIMVDYGRKILFHKKIECVGRHNIITNYYIPLFCTFEKQFLVLEEMEGTYKLDNYKRPVLDIVIISPENNKSFFCKALIDTGSPRSMLVKGIISALELVKVSDRDNKLMNGNIQGEYKAHIEISKNKVTEKVSFGVFETDDLCALIGTDILCNFELKYNSPKDNFYLKYVG